MSVRPFLIFSFLCLGSLAVQAEEAVSTPSLRGAGAGTCTDFSSFYHLEPTMAETQYFSWAQGFMSGLNVNYDFGYRDLSSMPPEKQKQHIRDYCEAHPTTDYNIAVFDLYRSLKLVQAPDNKK